MTDATPNTYDAVSYATYSHVQTHPDRLATLATLFGMQPPPIERARVLELGAGDGANLIPMANGLPESEFLGIELSARAVERGQAMIDTLALQNVTLRQLDIMNLPADLGQFDYIIAHGFYSWVPTLVRDRILAVCDAHLAPNGVAYVSYNAYPGGHVRNMVREMMLFHIREMSDPEEQINQARALIKFLAESKEEPDLYHTLLKNELERLQLYREGHVYHDDLEKVNYPVYFHQFIAHAAEHNLQFLAEADFAEMGSGMFLPAVSEMLAQLSRARFEMKEQYLDFLKGRAFRQTLLCRQGIELDRAPQPERMKSFRVASPARPVSPQPDIASDAVERFQGVKGTKLATHDPLAKAAITRLGKVHPRSLAFDELLTEARSLIGHDAEHDLEDDARELGEIILSAYGAGMVELRVREPHFTLEVSERPEVSPLARLQARHDTVVTNMRHESVMMDDPLSRHLLPVMDGTRDRAALLKSIATLIESGEVTTQEEGQPAKDRAEVLKTLSEGLEENLAEIARLALLIA